MIYFEPQAGLCNRMRSIESAYQIALELNTKLCIIWLCNADCKAKFSELYEKISGVELIEIPALFGTRTTVRYHRWRTKRLMKRCMETKKYGLYKDASAVRDFVQGKDVYVQSCGVWYPYEKGRNLFKPIPPIQEAIDKKKKELGEFCLGVHIRRTDHVVSNKDSGTELFVQRMQAELQKNPETRFFVASDSENEKKHMQKLFGERIVLNENIELKRNSKIGIVNAVKDLFLLACCNKILGSAESSYSTMASEIGNVECCTIRK